MRLVWDALRALVVSERVVRVLISCCLRVVVVVVVVVVVCKNDPCACKVAVLKKLAFLGGF